MRDESRSSPTQQCEIAARNLIATVPVPSAATGRRRFLRGFLAVNIVASLVALPSHTAYAKTIFGTRGDDRIVGTAKTDRIEARRGDDRVNGRRGGDRISGSRGGDRVIGADGKDLLRAGSGADHLNAADGKQDRVVNGGPGNDVCVIDGADQAALKSCEKVKVRNGGSGGGGGHTGCIGPQEDKVQAALGRSIAGLRARGGDAGPPRFSAAFYRITMTLKASLDGLVGGQLPISIEEVCDVPKSLRKDALKLAGGDGVAIVDSDTKVVKGGMVLQGQAARTALAGADTATLQARLKPRASWAGDEDGNPVPTFKASRIEITD